MAEEYGLKKIFFTIPGQPQGKGRPRFSRKGSHMHTPVKTLAYEKLIRAAYEDQVGEKRFSDVQYLCLSVRAYYEIPKSKSKRVRADMADGFIRPGKRPDIDNIIKVVADALNGLAYRDDAQIVDCCCRKFYADHPRVEVMIQEANI